VPFVPLWRRANLLNYLHREYGHLGELSIVELLRTRGWWPPLRKDTRYFIQHCPECQLAQKLRERYFIQHCPECQLAQKLREQHRDEMHPSHQWNGRTQPFERWGLDLIGPLPKTANGNRWVIIAVDYATGWPKAHPIRDATSEVLAEFMRTKIYRQYGAPKEVITDRGSISGLLQWNKYLPI
jgi:hypothetical protein